MLPAGTRVKLTAELADSPRPEILVEIGDNGPGLPQDALRAVFDPFSVQGKGVASEYGIHLMACFFIIHHHGGKMEARSLPGFGTTFLLRLPLQPERAAPSSEGEFLQKALLNQELWDKLLTTE